MLCSRLLGAAAVLPFQILGKRLEFATTLPSEFGDGQLPTCGRASVGTARGIHSGTLDRVDRSATRRGNLRQGYSGNQPVGRC
jgi:hypothetical protein